MDLDARKHWVEYSMAKDTMLKHTDSKLAPGRWRHLTPSEVRALLVAAKPRPRRGRSASRREAG